MKKRILRYIKHIGLTLAVLLTIAIAFGVYHGASVHYGDNPIMMNLDKEGPYVFYQGDSLLEVNYIRGNKEDGFYVDQKHFPQDTLVKLTTHFLLDESSFEWTIQPSVQSPPTTYKDGQTILAISDIESGYKAFRDFLIQNRVIDSQLNWTFGKGHLVLVGDFVDRGFSTTQVLWFIYKLEQAAATAGGHVHFIIGNHELKNMQGKYEAAAPKYYAVAAILGRQQTDLYSTNSVLGRWMASKNSIELINGHLFAHGGIHPDVADINMNLEEVNSYIRSQYYLPYYPKKDAGKEQLLISTRTGIAWYRGYFKADLTQEEVEKGLAIFDAKAIVVGHTLQSKVKSHFNKKVFAIDVKHPNDYHKNWPHQESEGLLIKDGNYYRLLANGEKIAF